MKTEQKTGRNTTCICGSGKKYKHCCLNKATPIPEKPLTRLKDKSGKPVSIGSSPGSFRVTIASPKNPNVVLHDLTFPLGTSPAKVRRMVKKAMQRQAL